MKDYYYDITPKTLIENTVFSEENDAKLFLPILRSSSSKSSIHENLLLGSRDHDVLENIKYVNYEDHKFTWDRLNTTKEKRLDLLEVFSSLTQYKIEIEFLYPKNTTNYKYVKDTFFTKIVNYLFSNKNVLSTLMFFKRIDDIVLVEIILFCTSPLNIKEIDDNTHNAARINFRITTIEDEKLREQYWFFKLHKEIFLNTNVSTDSSFILPFVCKGESELLEKLKEKLPHKEEAELDNLLLFFESALADWLPEWIYLTHDEEGAANFFNFVPTIIGRVGYEVRVVEKGGLEN